MFILDESFTLIVLFMLCIFSISIKVVSTTLVLFIILTFTLIKHYSCDIPPFYCNEMFAHLLFNLMIIFNASYRRMQRSATSLSSSRLTAETSEEDSIYDQSISTGASRTSTSQSMSSVR